ncbi:hypothetical protein BCT86_05645 [Vibrio breoganii]|uniref:prepilin peptidase n=1 Tax=Vibrio breoganii TaxID=553239 RepID=UPI000C858AD9|nr:prepilin peptidase [Vibrio breoganii]PMK26794.1 hypothetical protein BCU06_18200 [Vibrio breoganii]PMK99811.1 hypothetical protein BCT86_05645 [Vibrio breoganii]PML39640.1 hypothetical protein BCT77_10160 [Vibrio breoganii]
MLLIFSFLLVIAISDITENKIPNKVLVCWLGIQTIVIISSSVGFLDSFLGGFFLFSVGLVFYTTKAMSAGDVKLLGVLGYAIGWNLSLSFLFWVIISSGMIAMLYLARNLSLLGIGNPIYFFTDPRLFSKNNDISNNSNISRYNQKLTMPFAPCVVIGLALAQYFN